MKFQASVPGSIMLMGEHAVLQGKRALVCAVNRHIFASLIPRNDCQVCIQSALASCQFNLNQRSKFTSLKQLKTLRFVLKTIQHFYEALPGGFELTITSDFSHHLGLGTSAAVTVATTTVLQQWLTSDKQPLDKMKVYRTAKKIVLAVQGVGSGADVAASVFGAVVVYQLDPLFIEQLICAPAPLILVYSGYKTPTVDVVAKVYASRLSRALAMAELDEAIDQYTKFAIDAYNKSDWVTMGLLMNKHQQALVSMGVSDATLNELIECLTAHTGVYGAKISGSGLGDCVVGLGHIPKNYFPVNAIQRKHGVLQIPIEVNPWGIQTII
ncbi:mevalonate kinase family protein [Zooshikella sp. RANM57]|uniref:mevalonate kinase family protein n=1 Tax=Zooshikella sp. RANM57 TaxID=3425863 RepID=UPI003D6EC360